MKKTLTLIPVLLLFFSLSLFAQEPDLSAIVDQNSEPAAKEYVAATFKGFRIINAQSNETAKKHNLHFNIAHRFSDLASTGAGIHTFFGFDNAQDIRFSFDYGVTDRLQLGIGRSKGIDAYTQLYDGNIKYKLLRQTTDNKMPVGLSLYGVAAITGRPATVDMTSDASFQNTTQRLSYVAQAIITRKFSQSISLELIPSYLHRNYVTFNDQNDVFSLGAGARIKLTKRFAIIADYFHNFSSFQSQKDADGKRIYSDPLSIGIEIETGGHVFTINFTNSRGILENTFLPFTESSNWAKGQFRLGFNISRNFVIGGKKSW